MAVTHIVWMKFKQGVSTPAIQRHLEALRGLTTCLPDIQSLTVGENFTDRANGFSHGMVVILADRAALQRYTTDPEHVLVATALRADAELMALDYEV